MLGVCFGYGEEERIIDGLLMSRFLHCKQVSCGGFMILTIRRQAKFTLGELLYCCVLLDAGTPAFCVASLLAKVQERNVVL